MKTITSYLFFVFSLSLFAQQKGATPINEQPTTTTNQQQTYAVVVGISDYPDEGIPDLRFADKDALAFAEYLRSPAGGGLDGDHLKVLINEEATAGQVVIDALYWLLDECQEGDKAIIYFSGHGDVERKISRQPGHLLCWDAPKSAYMIGGTLRLGDLKDVIFTLSSDMGVQVTVITDACRSGKLAGNDIGGSQLTNGNLAQQYANEIKVLSCQPDEYSIEGEQWGGGRGAFSYHLVDGLYGLADRNGDLSVSLMELRGYLEEKVSTEVAPHQQLPMTVGNGRSALATVDAAFLAKVEQEKIGTKPRFKSTASRGIEEEVLAAVDSATQTVYRRFKAALKEKRFLFPETDCADVHYRQLAADDRLARLHNSMRRNYAAALQDESQQVIIDKMNSIDTACLIDFKKEYEKYRHFPAYLQRAVELLGKGHYMYPALQARQLFFEGYVMQLKHKTDRAGYDPQAEWTLYKRALAYEPDMPLALAELGYLSYEEFQMPDSAEYYFEKVLRQNPAWLYGIDYYNTFLNLFRGDAKRSKALLDRAYQVDSSSIIVLNNLGLWHYTQGRIREAEVYYSQIVDRITSSHCSFTMIAGIYLGLGYYDRAGEVIGRALAFDPDNDFAHYMAGFLHLNTGDYEASEAAFQRAVSLNEYSSYYPIGLSMLYIETDRFGEARRVLEEAVRQDSLNDRAYVGLFLLHMVQGEKSEAVPYMEKALAIRPLAFRFVRSYAQSVNWGEQTSNLYTNLPHFIQALYEIEPGNPWVHYEHARVQGSQGDVEAGLANLETAIRAGITEYNNLQNIDDFAAFRAAEKQWQALMEKYFPEEFDN